VNSWRTIRLAGGDEAKAATTQSGLRVPIIFHEGEEVNLTKIMNHIKDQFDDPTDTCEDEEQAPARRQNTDRRVEWHERRGRVIVRWTDETKKRKVDSKKFVVGSLSSDGAPKSMVEYAREKEDMLRQARKFWDENDTTGKARFD